MKFSPKIHDAKPCIIIATNHDVHLRAGEKYRRHELLSTFLECPQMHDVLYDKIIHGCTLYVLYDTKFELKRKLK